MVSMEFGVGSVVEGKVTGLTKFGAFVSLPEGKSGLVHISEIAYTYVNEVKDHLQEGQEEEGGPRRGGQRPAGRPVGFTGPKKQAEPVTFEDKLKQFMASSDSKLSEHHMNDRKSSRRGNRK